MAARVGDPFVAALMGGGAGLSSRVVIEDVTPQVDGGRFAVKRLVGEVIEVGATIFTDGHDVLAARLRHRPVGAPEWRDVPMTPLVNDRWTAEVVLETLGRHEFAIEGWVDRFASWRRGLARKVEAGQEVTSELLEGAALVRAAAERAGGADGARLAEHAAALAGPGDPRGRSEAALAPELESVMARHPDRRGAATLPHPLPVQVEAERAAFGAWYECFPRSMSPDPARPGTLRDLADRLDYVAGLGFDVLYLPPVHPIGASYRKGRNNTLVPQPGDPGSPWAIGASGGRPHRGAPRARHPRRLRRARRRAPASSVSPSRSTSRSSARPIIRGCASTRSGSGTARTAPSSTRRTRPRSTRTSTRSTSRATRGRRSGRRCATWCCSGSAMA